LTGRRFSEADIRRWAAEALISEEQAEAILATERTKESPAAGQAEVAEGLNLPTVLYYLGTSLAVVALFVFASLNWEDVSRTGRIPIIAAGMAALLTSGHYVRSRTPYVRGGGVLFALGVGMVSLFYLAIGDAIVAGDETIFSEEMLGEATLIQALSLATIVAALAWTGVPLVSLSVAGQTIALTISAGILWLGTDEVVGLMLILLATGGTLLLVGQGSYYLRLGQHGFWFSLSGHIAFFYGFTYLAMDEWEIGTALAYLGTFVAFIMVSVTLRQRLYLIAGVAGLYVFVFRLIFDTFEGSPFLPLALALVGVSMVALAIAYQRYRARLPLSLGEWIVGM
jgi:uncharacterized membrane protein